MAVCQSEITPATRPAFDFNTAKSTFFEVFLEPFRVVAVACVVGDEFLDSAGAVDTEGSDDIKPSDVAAFDPLSFSVDVGCPFSMVYSIGAVKFDPAPFVFFFFT